MRSNRPAIQDRILLRYRGEGHVRFDLPAELCEEEAAAKLEYDVRQLEGVRRVVVYRRSRKVSIRYLESICGFLDVARRLHACAPKAVLARQAPPMEKKGSRPDTLKRRILRSSAMKAATAKYQEIKETAQSLAILARAHLGKDQSAPLATEKDFFVFLNDLVAFYLIKLHWRQITTEWLLRPFAYRYQWLAALYLVFMMVRYRKGGK
jgi:hypothetical protein